ncbi:ML domain-containing protein [Mycena chlorophos]|uniref:Phosphatidylglycerol/phosphatidylinositol transfer protein n=1 Tax=Mycena chlorophos TaxID=658473 RepID=A0A8H6WDN3_MYCCL|nr:ML domain-containing protein [Mycena chlorophos]
MRLVALLFLSLLHAVVALEWVNCNDGGLFEIDSISLNPEVPVAGEPLQVTIRGQATHAIEDGATADVTVKLGLVKLLQKKFDACAEIARMPSLGISCPIQPQEWHTIVQTVSLPKEIPKTKFNVQVRGSTVDDEPMLCLDLALDFGGGSGSIFRSPFSK